MIYLLIIFQHKKDDPLAFARATLLVLKTTGRICIEN
jgi:hypothetical protein